MVKRVFLKAQTKLYEGNICFHAAELHKNTCVEPNLHYLIMRGSAFLGKTCLLLNMFIQCNIVKKFIFFSFFFDLSLLLDLAKCDKHLPLQLGVN